MDTCGNCDKIGEWIPKEKMPDIPDVMTRSEFWAYVKEHVDDVDDVWMSISMNSGLPHDGIICPICKKGWTIHNCHDTVVVPTTEVLPLNDFIGKRLDEVKDYYSVRVDARYLMKDDTIRNDRYIDLAPKPDYPLLKKNEKGWIDAKGGITNDYVIREGDDGYFNVWRYYHRTCNRLNLAFKEEKRFREIFKAAGFSFACLHHIPNKYCSYDKCAPWFRVETEVGTITIGWRKRVISINWSEAFHNNKDIIHLFEKEDVTKGHHSIHAWGWDKATEYLSKLYKALSA